MTQAMQRSGPTDLVGMLNRLKPEIERALPRHVSPDRMARVVMTALRTTRNLDACSQASFLGCVMSAAQLGLEPNTPLGHAYLIPRKNKRGGYDCTLMLGYQGMIDIALRSGAVSSIFAHAVKPGDTFEYELGLEPRLRHIPSDRADREKLPLTHVYAVARVRDAEPVFAVLTKAQVEARRARSPATKDGPWVTDYEAMARKTAVRALFPWVPKSVEMARAIALDEGADLGRAQGAAFDPAIVEVLQAGGLEVETEGEEAEEQPEEKTAAQAKVDELVEKHKAKVSKAEQPAAEPHDPETGEVIEPAPPAPRTREPGED